MTESIDYIDVLKLGFKREEYNDSVHFDERGWNDFLMELHINKQIYFTWDTMTREVDMVRIDKDCNIKGRFKVESYKQLVSLLIFFGKVDEPENYFTKFA